MALKIILETQQKNIKIYYTNCIILEVNNLNGKEQKQFIKERRKRKLANNIKARDLKQFIKKILLKINIKLYLKLRQIQERDKNAKSKCNCSNL